MARSAAVSGLVAALIALAGSVACRQVVGIGDSPPQVSDPTVCGLPLGTSGCGACVEASCCAESSACATDPVCAAYEGCLGGCDGDPRCRSQCSVDHPGGTGSDVSALSACLASHCNAACGLGCGGLAIITSPDTATACQDCFGANACTSEQACTSSADGDAYVRCLVACATPDCRQTCATTHTSGVTLCSPMIRAFSGTCSTPCGFGRFWGCVGSVSWPLAEWNNVVMTGEVDSIPSLTPVGQGVDVSVSEYCPPGVTGVLAQGQTNDSSMVTLLVPQAFGGAGTGHGLDGCLIVTSPSYLQTFWYWGYPLTAPAVTWQEHYDAGTPIEPSVGYLPLFGTALVMQLTTTLGGTPDSTRGVLSFGVHDCLGDPAPDVQVTTNVQDPEMRVTYGTTLDLTATATDSTGIVTIVNVPVGPVTLTATPLALKRPSSSITVAVAAATLTAGGLYPTP
jgi:hypothetical protein